ncbi:hypothetical protein Tco_1131285 [Tanacetum coccineum]
MSPAYVPDPMELDEHVPVYVPEPEHPEYHAPSGDDIQVEDQPYAEDASPTADEEHEPEDDDDDDDTDNEDEEPDEDEGEEEHPAPVDSSMVPVVDPIPSSGDTEAFKTDESAPTPRSPQTRVPFSQTRLCRARKAIRLKPPMSASMEVRIAKHVAAPIPPTSRTYDQAPLPESAAVAARAPRHQYDFVDTVKAWQGLICSPGHDAWTIARAADRAENVGYFHDARTDRRDIRLEIDVVRGQRTAYKTELHKVRQVYLNSEAQNRALLARLETLETHMSRMEWQRQRAEDDAVK